MYEHKAYILKKMEEYRKLFHSYQSPFYQGKNHHRCHKSHFLLIFSLFSTFHFLKSKSIKLVKGLNLRENVVS